ncbi:hypothetical protein H4R33_000566 [Dimargaris cristalligena]|nr:hypothetical protein H4R33_000566 [Dimargaris cristalligena]
MLLMCLPSYKIYRRTFFSTNKCVKTRSGVKQYVYGKSWIRRQKALKHYRSGQVLWREVRPWFSSTFRYAGEQYTWKPRRLHIGYDYKCVQRTGDRDMVVAEFDYRILTLTMGKLYVYPHERWPPGLTELLIMTIIHIVEAMKHHFDDRNRNRFLEE